MRGLLRSALLLAPALARAVFLEENPFLKNPTYSIHTHGLVFVHLPAADGLDTPNDLTFTLNVLESKEACGFANVNINGHPLPAEGHGVVSADLDRSFTATWNFTCVTRNDQPQEQLMNMMVESVEGQTFSDVGFTIRFQQITPVRISDIEGTASILRVFSFESPGDDGTSQKTSEDLELDAEFEELDALHEQLVELERVILMKEEALSEALGWGPEASAISDCDSLRCVVSSIYHKVSGAAKAFYAEDMEDVFSVGGGHRRHPHWRHKKFGGPHRRPRRPCRRPHHDHEAGNHTHGNHSAHHPPHEGMSRPGRHHGSPPDPHRGPPGRHHPGKFPHDEFPDEERPHHRRPRPFHHDAGDMPPEMEHHEHERPPSPLPKEDEERPMPSEDMMPVPPPTGGRPHRGPGRPKTHGDPERHGGHGGDSRRPPPSPMSRFPIRRAVKLGASLILVGVFISILHRRCFRIGGLSREERRAHRKARCAARRAARCQRCAECRGAGRGGFLRRFFCRRRCEAEEQEKAAMLSARSGEEDSDDERMSLTMDEEIASFQVAANMVDDIVAAEEGRACEERQQQQQQMLQIPQTVAPAPPSPTATFASFASFAPMPIGEDDEVLPAYEPANGSAASSVVADGFRYTPGSSEYTPSDSSVSGGADDILGDTKN